jgi:hypothetical protein
MPSFADSLDRLDAVTKSLHAIETASPSSRDASRAPSFTRAVLRTPLEHLIRDIDSSELGLFTLLPPTSALPTADAAPQTTVGRDLARVEYPAATPLRRPLARDARARPSVPKPEDYARAALRQLDR